MGSLLLTFQNQLDKLWPVFQKWRALFKRNRSSKTYLADFKTIEIGPGLFLVELWKIRYPIGPKDLHFPAFESFGQFGKLLAKNFLIQYIK